MSVSIIRSNHRPGLPIIASIAWARALAASEAGAELDVDRIIGPCTRTWTRASIGRAHQRKPSWSSTRAVRQAARPERRRRDRWLILRFARARSRMTPVDTLYMQKKSRACPGPSSDRLRFLCFPYSFSMRFASSPSQLGSASPSRWPSWDLVDVLHALEYWALGRPFSARVVSTSSTVGDARRRAPAEECRCARPGARRACRWWPSRPRRGTPSNRRRSRAQRCSRAAADDDLLLAPLMRMRPSSSM